MTDISRFEDIDRLVDDVAHYRSQNPASKPQEFVAQKARIKELLFIHLKSEGSKVEALAAAFNRLEEILQEQQLSTELPDITPQEQAVPEQHKSNEADTVSETLDIAQAPEQVISKIQESATASLALLRRPLRPTKGSQDTADENKSSDVPVSEVSKVMGDSLLPQLDDPSIPIFQQNEVDIEEQSDPDQTETVEEANAGSELLEVETQLERPQEVGTDVSDSVSPVPQSDTASAPPFHVPKEKASESQVSAEIAEEAANLTTAPEPTAQPEQVDPSSAPVTEVILGTEGQSSSTSESSVTSSRLGGTKINFLARFWSKIFAAGIAGFVIAFTLMIVLLQTGPGNSVFGMNALHATGIGSGSDHEFFEQRRLLINSVQRALNAYATANKVYPVAENLVAASSVFQVIRSRGITLDTPKADAIKYLHYQSDGRSYKLIFVGSGDCHKARLYWPESVDMRRAFGKVDCVAYGVWTPKAAQW